MMTGGSFYAQNITELSDGNWVRGTDLFAFEGLEIEYEIDFESVA